jgi:hypothetical protein
MEPTKQMALSPVSVKASGDGVVAVVAVHEDRVAADGVEVGVADFAVARAFHQECASAMDRPVAERWDGVGFEEGRGGEGETESVPDDVPSRIVGRADEADELLEQRDFDDG